MSANFGIAAGGENPGPSASGNAPALTASGGTNAIAPLGSLQEIQIETTNVKAEHGRVSGAQVSLSPRAGTNDFHGAGFYAFGHDAFDASDWFANSRNLSQPAKSLNFFGGAVGGPLKRNHSFFFASYEGMRLRQPVVGVTDVPSLSARLAVPASLRSFFDAFPLPTGVARTDGFAEFAASFANPAQHDLGDVRLDQMIGDKTTLRGRYTFAGSSTNQRGGNTSSLNTTFGIRSRLQTLTGYWSQTLSPVMIVEVRGNYSRARVTGLYSMDEFGGAVTPDDIFSAPAFVLDLNSRSSLLRTGGEIASIQRQLNLLSSFTRIISTHALKFGADYRRLSPIIGQRVFEEKALFNNVAQALTGVAARFSTVNHDSPQNPLFTNLSLYAQDNWRVIPRFTLSYGVRWEMAPAPASNGTPAFAVDQVTNPEQIELAPLGNAHWKTTFLNFAPRASLAYQLLNDSDDFLLRAGFGLSHDVSQDRSGDAFANSIPFVSGAAVFNTAFPNQLIPATGANAFPLMAFDPQLKLPYAINWNVALERTIGRQRITAAYVGTSGKRLLHTETLFDRNPDFAFLRLVTNRGRSDYRALQMKYETPYGGNFQASVSYSLARSRDNVSDDSPLRVLMTSVDPEQDRGPSDFDLRHHLAGYLSYPVPAPAAHGIANQLFRNWTLESIFNLRSARPLNVWYSLPTSLGLAYLRPDVVNGAPFFIQDLTAPGGRRLNAAAFVIPASLQQGNLARNSLRGFPFYQFDLALQRKFHFGQNALQIQVDAYNVFNHSNFEDPSGTDLVVGNNLAFGESTSLSGRSASSGGFGSFYGFGGARTLKFIARFTF